MLALTAARLGVTAGAALVSGPARAARAGARPPVRAAAAAAHALAAVPGRQSWCGDGRAHLEIHDLAGARATAQRLQRHAGVRSARVDPVLRRLIVDFD